MSMPGFGPISTEPISVVPTVALSATASGRGSARATVAARASFAALGRGSAALRGLMRGLTALRSIEKSAARARGAARLQAPIFGRIKGLGTARTTPPRWLLLGRGASRTSDRAAQRADATLAGRGKVDASARGTVRGAAALFGLTSGRGAGRGVLQFIGHAVLLLGRSVTVAKSRATMQPRAFARSRVQSAGTERGASFQLAGLAARTKAQAQGRGEPSGNVLLLTRSSAQATSRGLSYRSALLSGRTASVGAASNLPAQLLVFLSARGQASTKSRGQGVFGARLVARMISSAQQRGFFSFTGTVLLKAIGKAAGHLRGRASTVTPVAYARTALTSMLGQTDVSTAAVQTDISTIALLTDVSAMAVNTAVSRPTIETSVRFGAS